MFLDNNKHLPWPLTPLIKILFHLSPCPNSFLSSSNSACHYYLPSTTLIHVCMYACIQLLICLHFLISTSTVLLPYCCLLLISSPLSCSGQVPMHLNTAARLPCFLLICNCFFMFPRCFSPLLITNMCKTVPILFASGLPTRVLEVL